MYDSTADLLTYVSVKWGRNPSTRGPAEVMIAKPLLPIGEKDLIGFPTRLKLLPSHCAENNHIARGTRGEIEEQLEDMLNDSSQTEELR